MHIVSVEQEMSRENLNWILIENTDDEDDDIHACLRMHVVNKSVIVNTFAYSLLGEAATMQRY